MKMAPVRRSPDSPEVVRLAGMANERERERGGRPKSSVNYFVIPIAWDSPCSDAVRTGLDRSGAIRLPIKAAASGAQRASSRRNDAPCPPQRRPIFSKTRCARQVEQL